jgi:crotonobetainyl-CoA:carnitine CoA-transferase CaiB-like acyl-CoA transferase
VVRKEQGGVSYNAGYVTPDWSVWSTGSATGFRRRANKDGHGLWWKVIARNKRCVTLNLGTPEGQQILRDLVVNADVLVENFRPGVLEKWGLGPDRLHSINSG